MTPLECILFQEGKHKYAQKKILPEKSYILFIETIYSGSNKKSYNDYDYLNIRMTFQSVDIWWLPIAPELQLSV